MFYSAERALVSIANQEDTAIAVIAEQQPCPRSFRSSFGPEKHRLGSSTVRTVPETNVEIQCWSINIMIKPEGSLANSRATPLAIAPSIKAGSLLSCLARCILRTYVRQRALNKMGPHIHIAQRSKVP